MRKSIEVLKILCDGERHSGTAIAKSLGITRAAVWERVKTLRNSGVSIAAHTGTGYQLMFPIELLSVTKIRTALTPLAEKSLGDITLFSRTDSTSQRLLERSANRDINGEVCLAEFQTRGRGRRGDAWIAPLASGLYLSLGWRFERQPATFSALGLVVGVSVVSVLARYDIPALGLKWPNDIVAGGGKLGGILIELRSELSGPTSVVIGIGINTALADNAIARIDQPTTDMFRQIGYAPSRNELAAALLSQLVQDLLGFAETGFKPWRKHWEAHDVLRDQAVTLVLPDRVIKGVAVGVSDTGALLLRSNGAVQSHMSGRISRA